MTRKERMRKYWKKTEEMKDEKKKRKNEGEVMKRRRLMSPVRDESEKQTDKDQRPETQHTKNDLLQ